MVLNGVPVGWPRCIPVPHAMGVPQGRASVASSVPHLLTASWKCTAIPNCWPQDLERQLSDAHGSWTSSSDAREREWAKQMSELEAAWEKRLRDGWVQLLARLHAHVSDSHVSLLLERECHCSRGCTCVALACSMSLKTCACTQHFRRLSACEKRFEQEEAEWAGRLKTLNAEWEGRLAEADAQWSECQTVASGYACFLYSILYAGTLDSVPYSPVLTPFALLLHFTAARLAEERHAAELERVAVAGQVAAARSEAEADFAAKVSLV